MPATPWIIRSASPSSSPPTSTAPSPSLSQRSPNPPPAANGLLLLAKFRQHQLGQIEGLVRVHDVGVGHVEDHGEPLLFRNLLDESVDLLDDRLRQFLVAPRREAVVTEGLFHE